MSRNDKKFISPDQAQPPFFAGIDLGGTNIKVGVVDDLGQPLSWLTIPTEPKKGPKMAAPLYHPGVFALYWQVGSSIGQVNVSL